MMAEARNSGGRVFERRSTSRFGARNTGAVWSEEILQGLEPRILGGVWSQKCFKVGSQEYCGVWSQKYFKVWSQEYWGSALGGCLFPVFSELCVARTYGCNSLGNLERQNLHG